MARAPAPGSMLQSKSSGSLFGVYGSSELLCASSWTPLISEISYFTRSSDGGRKEAKRKGKGGTQKRGKAPEAPSRLETAFDNDGHN